MKRSSRPVGGEKRGSRVERTHHKAAAGGTGKAVAREAGSPTFASG